MKNLLLIMTIATSISSFANSEEPKVITDNSCVIHMFSGFQGYIRVGELRANVIQGLKKNGFTVIDHGASDNVFLNIDFSVFNNEDKLLLTEDNHGCSSDYLGGGWQYWTCKQKLNFFFYKKGKKELITSASEQYVNKSFVFSGLKSFNESISKQLPICLKH